MKESKRRWDKLRRYLRHSPDNPAYPLYCQQCHKEGPVTAHHYEENGAKHWKNVIFLCPRCHLHVHAADRKYYKEKQRRLAREAKRCVQGLVLDVARQ